MGDRASSGAGCGLASAKWERDREREAEREWYVKGSAEGGKDTPPCRVEIKGTLAAYAD